MGLAELDHRVEERVGDERGPGLQLVRSGVAHGRPLPHAGRLEVRRDPDHQEWHDHHPRHPDRRCLRLLMPPEVEA